MANWLTPVDKKLIGFSFKLMLMKQFTQTKEHWKQKRKLNAYLMFSSKTEQGFICSLNTRLTLIIKTKLTLNLPVYQWDLKGTAFLHNYRKEMLSVL